MTPSCEGGAIDVQFTKMEGLGNDYIYLDNTKGQILEGDLPALSRAVSDRHFGIGSDGLICVLTAVTPGHDFRFRMFNADGSEGEMCGNGMRCFAKFVYERGLTAKTALAVETPAGTIRPRLQLDDQGNVLAVTVDMGPPRLRRVEIPMTGPDADQVLDEEIIIDGQELRFAAVSMGNPHAVFFVEDVSAIDLEQLGPKIEHHPLFPRRVNAHFAQVLSPTELQMRTWERGSGITLACGTGAAAVLVAARLMGLTETRALIHLPGGDLDLEWAADGHVYKTGPATEVCRGEFTRPWR